MIIMRWVTRGCRICTADRAPTIAPNGESPLVHNIRYQFCRSGDPINGVCERWKIQKYNT